MKSLTSRFVLIGVTTLLGVLALWPPREKLKLGIDLSGGTILVYEVRTQTLPSNFSMDELIAALKRRVNPEGVLDIPIRKVGGNRIEIILPEASAEEVDEVKRKLTDVGSLEFRILANRKHDGGTVIDRAMGPRGLAQPPSGYLWARLGEVVTGTDPRLDAERTTLTDPNQRWTRNAYAEADVELTGKDSAGAERTVAVPIERNTADTLYLERPADLTAVTSYRINLNPSGIEMANPANPAPSDPIIRDEAVSKGRIERYILCKDDRRDVSGKDLRRTYSTQDDKLQPAVGFEFDTAGAGKFGRLTREHLPEEGNAFRYRLAILLDKLVMSAPVIEEEIRGSGIIRGGEQGFRAKEVEHLISILQSGQLPASLNPEPLQEEKVGPTLGEDTIAKGLRAIWISMLVVPLFMIGYYRLAGVVAVIALVLNIVLLVGSMALLQATFTLPGLAGLALTIGMAVDANVLIFERMREEAERGVNMAGQIRNGFSRAWSTIFDANVTTVLSGMVLWRVGTEEVKGFATTLIIGLVWNLFTAVFVSRTIFDLLYKQGWLGQRISMMKLLGKTNIDFIGARRACMLGSVIVIALGLGAVAMRGRGLLNIDFTGGTLVTIRLDENDPTVRELSPIRRAAFVREKAGVLPDATVESLNVGGEASGLRFNVRTTESDTTTVRQTILDAFGPSLQRVVLGVGEARPVPPAPATASGEAAPVRFPAGREYPLTLNVPQPPAVIANEFAEVLERGGIANPTAQFEVVDPKTPAGLPSEDPTTELVLRTGLGDEVAKKQLGELAESLKADPNLLFERLTNFGGVVAGETRTLAIIANLLSWAIIAGYLWFRFKSFTYGLAAIVAVVHDVLVTLGAVAATYWLAQIPVLGPALMLDQFKIDLPMIAAFLTLIGFSVNDTIVIFDRIREIKGKTPVLTANMINEAVNQTLSRTILTALTAWLVVVILYIFGGEGLHGFAFSLVVGLLSGTYSTIYIAAPILVDWLGKEDAKSQSRGQEQLVGQR